VLYITVLIITRWACESAMQ